ncbi:MAG: hypothetical protein RLZZ214_262, partial [Verrucomicrobiota bacterium]
MDKGADLLSKEFRTALGRMERVAPWGAWTSEETNCREEAQLRGFHQPLLSAGPQKPM